MITIALDAMGGDNCPGCNVNGALRALSKSSDVKILLVGVEEEIQKELLGKDYDRERLSVIHASEVISLDEAPVQAIQKKKDSSIVKGIALVKEGTADAFVSAGSSGAVLAAGQLKLGRIKGVMRPPLGTLIPNEKGVSFFLDLGANVDAKPEWLCQFAEMGSIYMAKVMNVKNPTVKLINLGLEDEKGNALTKAANELLRASDSVNYLGYAESREVPYGTADVIVADAFTGNAMLKMFEGTAGLLLRTIKGVLRTNLRTKIGGLLIKNDLKKTLKNYDASEHGGATLLGVKGTVIKCHGNSTEKEICNAILQAEKSVSGHVNELIAKAFEKV